MISGKLPGRVFGVIVTLALGIGLPASLRASPADILLLNGRIFTSSDNPSLVQALAIDSDRIAATGSDEKMRERAGAATHEGNR